MAPSPYDLSCWWDVKHKHNNNNNLPYFIPDKFAARSGLTNLAFPVSGNVIYTQWNLGGVHLMVRCSQHGNIKDANHKVGVLYSVLTLNAPIVTKVVCYSRLLKCLRSLHGKQCGPRSDCSYRSSLFWVHTFCFYI